MKLQRQVITMTVTDVNLELVSLLMGIPVIELVPTPQNRDTWRRATLEKA